MLLIERPRLLRVLDKETLERPPIWFMRQAGRSLPEYRALRTRTTDFVSFCLDPDLATEASLQPMRRFAFDAAIIFADILLLPGALGQKVWFEVGEGPRLGLMPDVERLRAEVESSTSRLLAVGETVRRVRAQLEPSRAVIGFAGGPWTVATYMLQGRGGDRTGAREIAIDDPARVEALVDVLVDATVRYLVMQGRAGADVLQLFESWAELLPEDVFQRLVTGPHARIVAGLREAGVTAPVIGFPRGAGALVERYADEACIDAVGLDVQAPAALGRRIQTHLPIQGALDPLQLRRGGPSLDASVDRMLEQWGKGPYIFNLGHGVLPDTPLAHIERVVARVAQG